MFLTEKHIKQFVIFYLSCFLINYTWFWLNGLLFTTIHPVFFLNYLDFTRNVLMLTNIQHFLIDHYSLRVCFDGLYLLLPITLTIAVINDYKGKTVMAFCCIAFTILYSIFFTSISYISIEGYISWILIPLVFSARTVSGFYYYLHTVRIIFILIIVSAAVAKIRSLAIFNVEQMSGILLYQHNTYLVSNRDDWFTKCIYYLVQHKTISYLFFLLATLVEISFAVGLFTRKFDRFLIISFCVFLIFDFFLMRINYFTWLVFMGCFYFSVFQLPGKKYPNGQVQPGL